MIVFKNGRAYQPFQPTYQGTAVEVAGYFSPGPMNYVTLVSNREGDYQPVVYHEFVHLILSHTVGVNAALDGERAWPSSMETPRSRQAASRRNWATSRSTTSGDFRRRS